MFGQNLPISAAFTDIENEATTVQRNRCVHTLSQTQRWPASDVTKRGYKNKWRCVVLKKNNKQWDRSQAVKHGMISCKSIVLPYVTSGLVSYSWESKASTGVEKQPMGSE